MNREDLEKQIRSAFEKTPRPQGKLTDSSQGDEGVEEYFLGTHWDGHEVAKLRYHSVGLNYFTPEAYRYYMPAFMLAELKDPDEADIIGETIAYHFGRPAKEWEPENEVRLRLFSGAEKAAILQFIAFLNDEYGSLSEELEYAHKRLS